MERLKTDLQVISQAYHNSAIQLNKLFEEQAAWREDRVKQIIAAIRQQKEDQEVENDTSSIQNTTVVEEGGRPKRTAQIKAQVKMTKQKNKFKGKLRRPTDDDLKEEENEIKNLLKKSATQNSVKVELQNDETDASSNNSATSSDCAVMPEKQHHHIQISDDDNEKMPPPAIPLKGTKLRSTLNKKPITRETRSHRTTMQTDSIPESENSEIEEDLSKKKKPVRKNKASEVPMDIPLELVQEQSTRRTTRNTRTVSTSELPVDNSVQEVEEQSTRRITRSSRIVSTSEVQKIKKEKESLSLDVQLSNHSVEIENNQVPLDSIVEIAEEQSSRRTTRNMPKGSNADPKSTSDTTENIKPPFEIKKEKLSIIIDVQNETYIAEPRRSDRNKKTVSDTQKEKEKPTDETLESVYEDAIATKQIDEDSVEPIHENLENNPISDKKLSMTLTVNLGPKISLSGETVPSENTASASVQIKKELIEETNEEIPSCDQTFDIISVPGLNETVTVTTQKPAAPLNETVVIDSNAAKHMLNETVTMPTMVISNNCEVPSASSLITDDESVDEDISPQSVEKPQITHTTRSRNQALFSSSSPVKSRVQAFEKVLNTETPPVRITRTKTRAMKNKEGSSDSIKENSDTIPNKNIGSALKPPRTKLYATPQSALRVLKKTSSYKNLGSCGNLSNIVTDISTFGTKPSSAMKPTVNRDEAHRKQIQKEDEALKKKDALFQAKLEEKAAKREEKARQVYKARLAKERERELIQQQAREKEEKHKQLLLEREEKAKEENRLKKQLASQKATEMEKRRKQEEQARIMRLKEIEEEQRKLDAQKKREQEEAERLKQRRAAEDLAEANRQKMAKQEQFNRMQIQMMHKKMQMKTTAPDSPFKVPPVAMVNGFENLDSGDSTDEEDKPAKVPRPAWSERKHRLRQLIFQIHVPSEMHDRFFSMQASTPNLAHIFPGIDPRKLRRKSSAIWKTPPRYSQMPKHL